MEQKPMTEPQFQRISKSLKQSQNLTRIFLVLGMVPVVIALIKIGFSDLLGASIIFAVSLFFFIPAIGSFAFSFKVAADVKDKIVCVSHGIVSLKHCVSHRSFYSYFIKIGKTEYSVIKETYDQITEKDKVVISMALHSGELLSLKNDLGDEFALS